MKATRFISNPVPAPDTQFMVAPNQIFPAMFTNFEDLSSAVTTSSPLFDTTTDALNDVSGIFTSGPGWNFPLLTTCAAHINISESDTPAGGQFSLSISSVATLPEPASISFVACLGVVLLARRRSRV